MIKGWSYGLEAKGGVMIKGWSYGLEGWSYDKGVELWSRGVEL